MFPSVLDTVPGVYGFSKSIEIGLSHKHTHTHTHKLASQLLTEYLELIKFK